MSFIYACVSRVMNIRIYVKQVVDTIIYRKGNLCSHATKGLGCPEKNIIRRKL